MLSNLINHISKKLAEQGIINAADLLEVPTNPTHGDIALPCFVLAKEKKIPPAAAAAELADKIAPDEIISAVASAGPYLNFFLQKEIFAQAAIAAAGETSKQKISAAPTMVEFFHANTHKAVHIGHIRNISLGESLCRLLESQGEKVLRVNYQGDIGPHVAKALWALRCLKDFRASIPLIRRSLFLADLYAQGHKASLEDEKAAVEIREANKKIYAGDPEWRVLWQETRQWCLDDFETIYKQWGVKYNRFYFESEVEEAGKKLAEELLEQGVLEKSQGAIIANLENERLNVLVVVTGEGTPLYAAKDLALAQLKIFEYPDMARSLHLVGHEQELYFNQLFVIFKKADFALADKSEHVVYALVRKQEGKMASRAGNVVTYFGIMDKLETLAKEETRVRHQDWDDEKIKEASELIALAGLKFSMLRLEPNKEIIFDEKDVLRFDGDTGPYLLYTYARCRSIERKAGSEKSKGGAGGLDQPEERILIRLLAQYDFFVKQAAGSRRPSVLAAHLLDLAHGFNEFYHKHKVLEADHPALRAARLILVGAVRKTIKNGLHLLGIETLEEM